MYKWTAFLIYAFLFLPLQADAATIIIDPNWKTNHIDNGVHLVKNDKPKTIILLEAVKNKEGLSLSYKAECISNQKDINDVLIDASDGTGLIFSCAIKNGVLSINPNAEKAGSGTINIVFSDPVATDQKLDIAVSVIDPNPKAKNLSYIETEDSSLDWSKRFYSGLFIGAEGESVSQVDSKTIPRIEFFVHRRLYDFAYLSGSIRSHGSEEQTDIEEDKIESAISGNIDLMIGCDNKPWFKNCKSEYYTPHTFKANFLLSYGLRKVGDESAFNKKYYVGLRFTANKLQYFDILIGKTELVAGQRLELRGQYPLRKSNILLGTTVNVGINDSSKENIDSITLYVTKPIDFTGVFSNL